MWRCRDRCSVPSLAPKSPHPIIYEGHFTPLSCYRHWTWSNFQIPIADVHLLDDHSNAWLVHTVCAVLDFIYLARYPIHTSKTLAQINDALHAFHLNWNILVSLGICTYFNIPKLHNSDHYYELIQLCGTADNFNTEFTKHLHIDLARMYTLQLILRINDTLAWLKRAYDASWEVYLPLPGYIFQHTSPCPKTPSFFDPWMQAADGKAPNLLRCAYWGNCTKYGATQSIPALSCFVAQYQHPEYLRAQVEAASVGIN